MKTSFRKLIEGFDQAAGIYFAKHEKDDTKMTYAIKRVVAQVQLAAKRFNESIQETFDGIRLDHCLTEPPDDPKGKVLRSANGGYEFTKDGERACKKALNVARNEAMDREDIEITPHFVSQVPDDLTEEQIEAFSGLVIKPEQAEAMLRARREVEDEPQMIPETAIAETATAS